eukprot:scaffold2803_cov96-Skeletonema_marinoi.AAC.3
MGSNGYAYDGISTNLNSRKPRVVLESSEFTLLPSPYVDFEVMSPSSFVGVDEECALAWYWN